VRGIDGASRNNKRPCGVADSLQVSQHRVEFHVDDSSNVFAKDESGSCFLNKAEHLRPERTVILRASPVPGHAERLARKSTCDEVNPVVIGSVEAVDVGDKARTGSPRSNWFCSILFSFF